MSGQNWRSRLTGNSRGRGAGPNLNVVSGRQQVQGLPNPPSPTQSVYTVYSSSDEDDQVAGTEQEVAGSTPDYTPRSPSPTPRQAEGGSGTPSENGSEERAPAGPSGGPSNPSAPPPSFPRRRAESQDGRWNDRRRQSNGQNWAARSRPFNRHLDNRTGTRGRATAPDRYQPYYENRQETPYDWQYPMWSADHHSRGSQRYREGYRQDSRSGERGRRESRDRERRGSGDRERERRSRSGEPVHRGSRQREQWDRRGSGGRGHSPNHRSNRDRQERRAHSSHHHDERRHRQRNSRRSPPRPGTSHGAQRPAQKMETVKLPAREIINLIRTCREPGCGNRVFPTRRQATLHLKNDHNKKLCLLCFQTFSTMRVEHLRHFLSAHADDRKETAECPMEGCPRSFTNRGLYGHLSKCHLVPEEKDDE